MTYASECVELTAESQRPAARLRSVRRSPALPACVALFALLGACDSSSPPEPRPAPGQPATAPAEPPSLDELRSLPYAGFSDAAAGEPDGLTCRDAARAQPGYTLVTVHELCRADLLDETGGIARTWRYQPSREWANAELMPDGALLVPGQETDDIGSRYLIRFDPGGSVQWKNAIAAHHDVESPRKGQILTLTFERRSGEKDGLPDLRDDGLTLLSLEGKVAATLSIYDALRARPDVFTFQNVAPTLSGGKPWVDLLHTNSCETMRTPALADRHPLYGAQNVLVCFRHQDAIAVIDTKARAVVWTWGRGELSCPHDAQVLENGHITVFDNGVARGWSRVIEVDPLTGRIVWEYKAKRPRDFFSLSKGSAQRLANGNTLICNSDRGQVFEVTAAGDVVWEYFCPHRNDKGQRATLVRAKRYDAAFIESVVLRGPGRPGPP